MNARDVTQTVFDLYKPYIHESHWVDLLRCLKNGEVSTDKNIAEIGERYFNADEKYIPIVRVFFDLLKPYRKGSPHWEDFVMNIAGTATIYGVNITSIEVKYRQDSDEIDKIKFRIGRGYTFCILEPWRRLPDFEGDNWQEAYPEEYERILGLLDSVKEYVTYYDGDTPIAEARVASAAMA